MPQNPAPNPVTRRVGSTIEVPVPGRVTAPPPEPMVDVIDWPVSVLVAGGHLLPDQHWSRAMRGLGEAIRSWARRWRTSSDRRGTGPASTFSTRARAL